MMGQFSSISRQTRFFKWLSALRKNDVSKRSSMPCRRVLPAQSVSWPETRAIQEIFQRHEPLPKPEPDAATKAGLVRPAQDPGVVAAQRMSPKRSLADVGDPDPQTRLAPDCRRNGPHSENHAGFSRRSAVPVIAAESRSVFRSHIPRPFPPGSRRQAPATLQPGGLPG